MQPAQQGAGRPIGVEPPLAETYHLWGGVVYHSQVSLYSHNQMLEN